MSMTDMDTDKLMKYQTELGCEGAVSRVIILFQIIVNLLYLEIFFIEMLAVLCASDAHCIPAVDN